MPTPSLLIVPARFKSGKLYSQIPTSGSGDFTVTRATAATRVNASGFIESVASGIPRLDYFASGGTVGCPALLVEPSAQNVIVQSQNWLASGWRSDATANVTTVSSTTGTLDPLGTNTANAISPTSGNTSHLKVGSDGAISYTSGTIYTASAFFKQGTGSAGRYVQITHPIGTFTQGFYANFDLQLGTIAATGSVSSDTNRAASIENYGNGWYRCRVTATCNASGSAGSAFALISSSGSTRTPSFSGTTTDVIYGWGAQTETGSVATSYIPTTTAAVTRNADVISLSGAVSGCIGQTEGTIYWEGAINNYDRIFLSLTSGTSNSQVVRLQTTGAGLMQLIVVSGTIQANIATSGAITLGQSYKVAVAYKQDDFVFYLNGAQVGTDTSGTIPTALTQIQFSNAGATDLTNQRCRAAALYTTRLTNAQLAALTTP